MPASFVIVAKFYDIESGRNDLEHRGHGDAHKRFPTPIARDGGIADMLDEATSGPPLHRRRPRIDRTSRGSATPVQSRVRVAPGEK
jgi:hypothetical protein